MNFQNDEVSSKELLSQFKTEVDVSKFVPEAITCPGIGKHTSYFHGETTGVI